MADAREARAAEQLNGADPGRYAPGSAPLRTLEGRLISRWAANDDGINIRQIGSIAVKLG